MANSLPTHLYQSALSASPVPEKYYTLIGFLSERWVYWMLRWWKQEWSQCFHFWSIWYSFVHKPEKNRYSVPFQIQSSRLFSFPIITTPRALCPPYLLSVLTRAINAEDVVNWSLTQRNLILSSHQILHVSAFQCLRFTKLSSTTYNRR